MDRCFICGSKDNLWYCYPVPGGTNTTGYKLCLEHQTIMEEKPEEFKQAVQAVLAKKGKK